ncbi:MAG: YcaO-like family protein [Desulfobacterales bacterium]
MQPIVLQDAIKTHTADQDKRIAPEETLRRFLERARASGMDLIRETRRIDSGRLGIPVFISRCGSDARAVIGTLKQMGKGASPAQAEASAVMELAERFSFFSFVRNPEVFQIGTRAAIGSSAMDFSYIARSVQDDSDDLEAGRALFEALPLRWTWATDLARGTLVRVPFDWFFAINEFNGPSAGNCLEEAILQGLCEVVERHVCSRVCHEKIPVRGIRPASVRDPIVRGLLERFRACGVELRLSDFSLDTGIPTVGALAWDPATFPRRSEIVWTAGTTPSPVKALARALTETAQLAGDFDTGGRYVASGLPKPAALNEVGWVVDPVEEVDLDALPELSHPNLKVEIERCLAALGRVGLEAFVVDTTHPRLRIPACYVIVPGAHFRERSRSMSVALFAARHAANHLEPERALALLDDLERRLPGKYYVSFYRGLALVRAGRSEESLSFFRQALVRDPHPTETAGILSHFASALKDCGRYAEAIPLLRQGVALDAERIDLWNLLGFCHFKRSEYEEAVAAFRRAIELDPGSAIDHANLGVNLAALGRREEAIEALQTALALDPGIEFARNRLKALDASPSAPGSLTA